MKNCILLIFIPFILQSQESYIVGDVDCNSVLNSEDASLILQYVTGSVESLPCQENLMGLTSDQLQEIVDMISSVGVHNDTISMFGPMYLYSECDENCLNVDYIFGAQESNEIYYFEALAFCAQLEYEGFTDWKLPTISALYYWVSQNNSNILTIPNFSNNGGMFFLNIMDNIYANDNPQVYISSYGGMLYKNNGALGKCFCVR